MKRAIIRVEVTYSLPVYSEEHADDRALELRNLIRSFVHDDKTVRMIQSVVVGVEES